MLFVSLSGLTLKCYQVDAGECRRSDEFAMLACLITCCGSVHAHVISSSLNLIWLVCPPGWGDEMRPAGSGPRAAVSLSAWSLQELVMRPAKSFFSCLSQMSVRGKINTDSTLAYTNTEAQSAPYIIKTDMDLWYIEIKSPLICSWGCIQNILIDTAVKQANNTSASVWNTVMQCIGLDRNVA